MRKLIHYDSLQFTRSWGQEAKATQKSSERMSKMDLPSLLTMQKLSYAFWTIQDADHTGQCHILKPPLNANQDFIILRNVFAKNIHNIATTVCQTCNPLRGRHCEISTFKISGLLLQVQALWQDAHFLGGSVLPMTCSSTFGSMKVSYGSLDPNHQEKNKAEWFVVQQKKKIKKKNSF